MCIYICNHVYVHIYIYIHILSLFICPLDILQDLRLNSQRYGKLLFDVVLLLLPTWIQQPHPVEKDSPKEADDIYIYIYIMLFIVCVISCCL